MAVKHFVVSTDAAADLPVAYTQEHDVKLISMKYYLSGGGAAETEYVFGNGEPGLSPEEFYTAIRAGKTAKTALVNEEEHKEHFERLIADGAKAILHIPLSSGLSGTAENGARAAAELNQKYPDCKIIVFDFKGAAAGQGLGVDHLVRLRDEGKTIGEAEAWLKDNYLRLCHFFTVDDLHHLRRGGRISGFKAFVGTILKIKPLLHVNDEGKLVPLAKEKGRKMAIAGLVKKMEELMEPEKQRVFISHGDCKDDLELLKTLIEEKFKSVEVVTGWIGPIIGAHSGPGTLTAFFLGKHR